MRTADLSAGRTAYELSGEGPLLVLVHGLSTPSFVWDAMLPYLHSAGYSTLRFDLYGRGGSAAWHRLYDADLYTRQLFELLDHLSISEPVHLVGYSMGGGIVTSAAAEQPNRVASLSLLAPTGFKTNLAASWPILNYPILGPIYMEMFGGSVIRMSCREEARKLGLTSNIGELQARATYKPGFMRAVRKSIHEGPMEGLEPQHHTLANYDIPMLAIWGDADTVIPISGHDALAAINPGATQHVIPGATHAFAYTHEGEVAQMISGFISSL